MKAATGGICFAFAASIFGNLGCGSVASEESVAQLTEALDIADWDDLAGMGTTGSYRLTNNIDATGKTWTAKGFSGTFDGNNRTISNLTIQGSAFFTGMTNATVKNVKFTKLTITGVSIAGFGGIAGFASDSTIENCAVEVNLNTTAISVGGLVGSMYGGSIYRSYAKGTIQGSISYAGGLVGWADESSAGGFVTISESYAEVTVAPDTSSPTKIVNAGGLVGYGYATNIYDVYAVGNVTGRGGAGGIVGNLDCTEDETAWLLYKTIYRGDVVDRNWSAAGGWAGAVGIFTDCTARFSKNFYDRTLDSSTNYVVHGTSAIQGFTTSELRTPTTVTGGVFCAPDVVPDRCGDNTWQSPPWTAGTSTQHHVLQNMPGPNRQKR